MKNDRAIPQGYMTVGEVAEKMDVTVRALQHYDRVGLLAPSSMSEGGRRNRLRQMLLLNRRWRRISQVWVERF